MIVGPVTSLILASQPLQLASHTPGGVLPTFVGGTNVAASGAITMTGGALFYQPQPTADGIYLFGHTRVVGVDLFGAGLCCGVARCGWAWRLALLEQLAPPPPPGRPGRVDASADERFWHWPQTVTIILLLLTGLIIHRPDLLAFLPSATW